MRYILLLCLSCIACTAPKRAYYLIDDQKVYMKPTNRKISPEDAAEVQIFADTSYLHNQVLKSQIRSGKLKPGCPLVDAVFDYQLLGSHNISFDTIYDREKRSQSYKIITRNGSEIREVFNGNLQLTKKYDRNGAHLTDVFKIFDKVIRLNEISKDHTIGNIDFSSFETLVQSVYAYHLAGKTYWCIHMQNLELLTGRPYTYSLIVLSENRKFISGYLISNHYDASPFMMGDFNNDGNIDYARVVTGGNDSVKCYSIIGDSIKENPAKYMLLGALDIYSFSIKSCGNWFDKMSDNGIDQSKN